jgi:hypothetical protein
VESTAHEHHLAHPVDDARLLACGEGDVREPAGGHEGDLARLARHDRLDDQIDRVPRVELQRRLGQHGPVHARFAMDVWGQLDRANERPWAAGREGNPHQTCDLGHRERVAGDLLERLVAHHGGHGDEFDFWTAVGEQDGDGVVVPGIAVQDDLAGHGGSFEE